MIFCFSGTGNSRYIAKRIAEALEDDIIDLNARIKARDTSSIQTGQDVILVTPTYAWRDSTDCICMDSQNRMERRQTHLVRDGLRR